MTFPYDTQQAGWADFASELDALALGINPSVLLRGQYGGKISEAIDELKIIVTGVEGLSDSAAELSAVCGVQDSFDRELAACPATKERVEEAEAAAKKAQALLRAGQCEPELAELVIARADELAQQRREAVEKHAADTATTHFDDPESVEWPDAHYPGGEPGSEPGKKGGDDGTPFGDFNGEDQPPTEPGETPEPGDKPQNPLEPEKPPMQAPMHPEPGSGRFMTPMTPEDRVTPLPETVTPETTLSRGDASLVAPSSSMLGQPTPTAPSTAAWQPPQYTGISPGQSRMLGNVNPNNSPQRKDKQEPEWNRPVPAETLAAIPVAHAVASTPPSALSPNVGTPSPTAPGTHTSSANVPTSPTAPSTPSGSNLGPTPMSTVGPGSRASVTGGGMREKPSVPDTLRAVLSEETVRDLEKALSNAFPDPEPPNTDPVPTGALR